MFANLPETIQAVAEEAYATFLENSNNPSLRHHELKETKKGRHKKSSWSVSVTLRYRAIYFRDGDDNVWYWIGSHEDYNQFVGNI